MHVRKNRTLTLPTLIVGTRVSIFSDWSHWTLKVTHDVNSKWTVPGYSEIEVKYLQWALSNSETVMMSFSLIGKIEFLSKVQKELHLQMKCIHTAAYTARAWTTNVKSLATGQVKEKGRWLKLVARINLTHLAVVHYQYSTSEGLWLFARVEGLCNTTKDTM